ncbi:MAG: DHHA1 domain-containing protein [Proteobacteria bacterium]|nr:DHHA1 domain-containing protein [Pseudomonadota bacterium]
MLKSTETSMDNIHWQPRFSATDLDQNKIIAEIMSHRDQRPPPTENYSDPVVTHICEALRHAIHQKKRILLYGDYDVDGTMSCVLWIWFFQAIQFDHYDFYIPRREKGYGVHLDVIQDYVRTASCQVVITMDTGVTAGAVANWCHQNQVLFIVTDHHEVQPDKLPKSGLVINPKLSHNRDYDNLCGAGITYLVIDALIRHSHFMLPATFYKDALTITALATVCDVMPLSGGNRRLVQNGLTFFAESTRPILLALRERFCRGAPEVTDFSFRIGPLINAAGRLADATLVVKGFTQDQHPQSLEHNIQELIAINHQRKNLSTRILHEAELILQESPHLLEYPLLFLGHENWHPGVLGIVAGRLAEMYHKPTWLFSLNKDKQEWIGSARSMPQKPDNNKSFDLLDAMVSAEELFHRFGGHKSAGGFAFPEHHRDKIFHQLLTYSNNIYHQYAELWQVVTSYDCELSSPQISDSLAKAIAQLQPFGHGYEEPVFLIRGHLARCDYYHNKNTGKPGHTALFLHISSDSQSPNTFDNPKKVIFFNQLIQPTDAKEHQVKCLVHMRWSLFRSKWRMELIGIKVHLSPGGG